MRSSVFSIALATGLCTGSIASAATLGLTTDTPTISASFALVEYLEFPPDGELFSFGAEVDATDGVTTNGFTTIDFVAGFGLADPTNTTDFGFGGFLDVSDEDGQFLVGDLFAIGFTEDTIELQYSNLTGLGAGSFGSSVLAIIELDDPLDFLPDFDPFAGLFDLDVFEGSITIENVAPIPLPAGFLLMGTALAGFGLAARRRKQN